MSDGTHRECPGAKLGIFSPEELVAGMIRDGQPSGRPRVFVRLFKPQFKEAVRDETKRQTIRPLPKRLPRPGDMIDCRAWTGRPYRSKQEYLGVHIIKEIHAVTIHHKHITTYHSSSAYHTDIRYDLDTFAQADGFPDWPAMRAWFTETHSLPFYGVLIKW